MRANYVQRGETIDYVNVGNEPIIAGTVVKLGNRIGVAGCDIPFKSIGSLNTAGVFEVLKASTTTAFAIGDIAYYDDSGAVTSGDVEMGWVVQDSPAGAATVKVKIG